MSDAGGILTGAERAIVHNRLRAWVGRRLELPALLDGVPVPRDARTLELGAGLG